jgi:hypothetical protein
MTFQLLLFLIANGCPIEMDCIFNVLVYKVCGKKEFKPSEVHNRGIN